MTTVHGYGANERTESMTSDSEFSKLLACCSLHCSIAESEIAIATSCIVTCSLFVQSDGHRSSVASDLGLVILSQLTRFSCVKGG